ncbi:hypothetical protein [Wolbachia endosymbiont (group B) of Camptogramma bilineatum]|uniref:hypothetical protein n=1 Tax=Wolbachia endosymbiont (group B) of Camptogramma bilineatum TaxID=2953991 RepID=UPI0022321394|nr:hypothetical protein [Wolbachia endosymbiont (group B) of Camptogramma bilineatum]
MDNDTKEMLFALGIATSIGALTGLELSFTTLSPLVMGGIVGSIVPALITALFAGKLLYKFCKKDHIQKDEKYEPIYSGISALASAAIGVGLAAATMAIFPSATLGMGSAALAGAIIAPIAVIAGFLVAFGIIEPIAQKVNEYIVSPIVERFSSKGEEKAI